MEKRSREGGGERDVRILCQHKLHHPVTRLERPNVSPIHHHLPLHARRFVLDSHLPPRTLRKTRIPHHLLLFRTLQRRHENHQSMDVSPRTHQAIPQERVLVQHMAPATELQIVLMLPLLELHVRGREDRLEHDLCRSPTEVEDGVCRCIRRRGGFDSPQEVIGRDPRVYALILAVHNHHSIFLLELERIRGAYPLFHRVQNVGAL